MIRFGDSNNRHALHTHWLRKPTPSELPKTMRKVGEGMVLNLKFIADQKLNSLNKVFITDTTRIVGTHNAARWINVRLSLPEKLTMIYNSVFAKRYLLIL